MEIETSFRKSCLGFLRIVGLVVSCLIFSSCGGVGNGVDSGRTSDAPTAEELSELLKVPIEEAPNEINQYLIRAPQGSVDLSKVGTINTNLGYAVGVTLPSGVQIGFRYQPLEPSKKGDSLPPTSEELTQTLGVSVEKVPDEANQYLIRAPQGSVDFSKIGKIHTDLGYAVGVTLPDGLQIGFRFAPPRSAGKQEGRHEN